MVFFVNQKAVGIDFPYITAFLLYHLSQATHSHECRRDISTGCTPVFYIHLLLSTLSHVLRLLGLHDTYTTRVASCR